MSFTLFLPKTSPHTIHLAPLTNLATQTEFSQWEKIVAPEPPIAKSYNLNG